MFGWLLKWLRPDPSVLSQAQAHMTFGQTSFGQSVARTRLFLRNQLWIWPIIAVLILSTAGYLVSRSINRTMKASLSSELQTLLHVERSMLEKWLEVQKANVVTLANDQEVRQTVIELLAANPEPHQNSSGERLAEAGEAKRLELRAKLQKQLDAAMSSHDFAGYILSDKRQSIVAAQTPELVGRTISQYESLLTATLAGAPAASAPFPSSALLKDRNGRMRTEVPTMFVAAPVRDDNLQIVAALALRIQPEREFTEILQLGRLGDTGETYAIDKEGTLVSNSRFDEELFLLGLIPDREGSHSILNLQIRDPGGDLATGFRPKSRRSELPLTKICESAIGGTSGVNIDGYRNYRGTPSLGAWTWLPEYQIGLITEISSAEAFRPLTILRWSFYSLYALLGISAIAIFIFTLVVSRLHREAQKATIEAKQLGQYRLETQLGAGAMGVVYKGHHSMLRRPTAIKMLQLDKVNEATLARFEREVQITCKLNHPSTIAIYDFGHTPEGVFYYAMEFLDGIDLQTLIERYGPQSDGRVNHILRQICGSLFEAHSLGLVHRDIKPANIMLNRRGGESDVVKVLDFGLVKDIDQASRQIDTAGLSGTPLYMSPESIQSPNSVDGRSDLYALGAVGYYLLTGQTVFQARSFSELCQRHLVSVPESPSKRTGRPITEGLENAILACLDKNRANRPQTARDLAKLLMACNSAQGWTTDEADAWWGRHERELAKSYELQPADDNPSHNRHHSSSGTVMANSQIDKLSATSIAKAKTATSALDQTITPS